MVEANILCPTKSHPELAWIREKPLHPSHYITDVEYTVTIYTILETKQSTTDELQYKNSYFLQLVVKFFKNIEVEMLLSSHFHLKTVIKMCVFKKYRAQGPLAGGGAMSTIDPHPSTVLFSRAAKRN